MKLCCPDFYAQMKMFFYPISLSETIFSQFSSFFFVIFRQHLLPAAGSGNEEKKRQLDIVRIRSIINNLL